MKLRSIAYVYIVIEVILLIIIASSLMMEYLTSKLLPLLVSSLAFVLVATGLAKEIKGGNKPREARTGDETSGWEKTGETGRGYLINSAWLGGFTLSIYLLGFIVTIPAFVLSYMKWLGTSWLAAFVYTVITTLLVFAIFELALKVQLYRGILLIWLGY